jgi:cholesterol transport system auxiliary component
MKRFAALLLVLLTACSLPPKDAGRGYMFTLTGIRPARQELIGTRVIVAIPEAAPDLDTSRVALLRGAHIRDYYAGISWADFLPELVQDDLVSTLRASGLFTAVASDTSGGVADRLLKTDIRNFDAEYGPGGGAPVIRVRLAGKLQSRLDRRTLLSFEAEGQSRATEDRAAAIHTAFQRAFNSALQQVVAGLAEHP